MSALGWPEGTRPSAQWGLNWEPVKVKTNLSSITTYNSVIASNIEIRLPLFAPLNTCNELVEEYLINQTLDHSWKNKKPAEFYQSYQFFWHWSNDSFLWTFYLNGVDFLNKITTQILSGKINCLVTMFLLSDSWKRIGHSIFNKDQI